MWIVGLRRSLALSAEASTTLACRRVLPTGMTGQSLAVSRAFSGTALNMQASEVVEAAAAASTPVQKKHPALLTAIEKEKQVQESLRLKNRDVKQAEKNLQEEQARIEKDKKLVADKFDKKVEKVEEQIEKIKKAKLEPAARKEKTAALLDKIRTLRQEKADEVKTNLPAKHQKAIARAKERKERAEQKVAKQKEKLDQVQKRKKDLAEEFSYKSLKFTEPRPRTAFGNFMSSNLTQDKQNPRPRETINQVFAETVAKWHTLTKDEQAKYTTEDYDAKRADYKIKKAAWRASLTRRQRGLLKHPRTPGLMTSFTLFAREHIVPNVAPALQMKGLAEKFRALTDAEKEDYTIRAAEITSKAKAAAAAAAATAAAAAA